MNTPNNTNAQPAGQPPELRSTDWLAKTPRMKDGTPIFIGDEVWFAQDGYDDYPWTRPTKQRVESLSIAGRPFIYNGEYTVGCGDWEGGNLDCYRTAEEVPGVDHMANAGSEPTARTDVRTRP